MRADVGTTSLYYETAGKGPTILAMHGGLGLDHSYLRGHDALADAYRIVYYDHRANGRSPRGNLAVVDHTTWQDDAAALIDQLGEDKAIIYGHSYGSWIALGFAVRYPQRVKALVLCGAAPAFDYIADIEASLAKKPPEIVQTFGAAMAAPPESDDAFRTLWLTILPLYFHRYEPRYAEAFARTHYSASGYLLGAAHIPSYNLVAKLPTLAVPTVVMNGGDDFITPVSQARRIAAAANGVDVIEFAHSGHFPFLEEPERYLTELRGWLHNRS